MIRKAKKDKSVGSFDPPPNFYYITRFRIGSLGERLDLLSEIHQVLGARLTTKLHVIPTA